MYGSLLYCIGYIFDSSFLSIGVNAFASLSIDTLSPINAPAFRDIDWVILYVVDFDVGEE